MEAAPNADVDPADGRDETSSERSDRNWSDILQELRVSQTGTQIISGFLLTLVFQQRFAELDAAQVSLYVGLVLLAAATTAVGLAPVALHRSLFAQHEKKEVVATADRLLRVVLVLVSALTGGVVVLIVSVALNWAAGWVSGSAIVVLLIVVLVVVPTIARRDGRDRPE